jgi:hypothetical protein
MDESVSDDELRSLIREKAEDHNLPPELLLEIYEAEREVVNMDRRSSILKDVGSLLEDHVDEN